MRSVSLARRPAVRARLGAGAGLALLAATACCVAATISPPMLDINKQCEAATRHNVTAMSECIVAESEARANLLHHWDKMPNDNAEKCVKYGRKAKRLPYSAMEKCLAPDIAAADMPPPAAAKR